jgi:hypothetical protein
VGCVAFASVVVSATPSSEGLPEWTDWASFGLDVFGALAILLAGFFAWWKFFKGRTFKYRLEPTVTGELVSARDVEAIRARLVLKNTGASRVKFGRPSMGVHVATVRREAWGGAKAPAWGQLDDGAGSSRA